MDFLRQWQLLAAPGGDEVEFDASVMLLLGSAKACISQVRRDPCAIGASAACEHDGDRINEPVGLSHDALCIGAEQFFDEEFTSRSEFIQAAVDALIGGQGGEPLAPVLADVIIDAALSGVPLHVPKQVDG